MKRKKSKQSHAAPEFEYSPTDPFGSYTGRSKDNDKPVQDADDL